MKFSQELKSDSLEPKYESRIRSMENENQSFSTFRNFLYSDGDFPIISLN